MKNVLLTLLAILFAGQFLTAQNSGRGFNYQAIARNINGQVLQNEMVILQFGLYAGQYVTEPTWQELQLANTDEFGAFSLTVGHGQKSGGTVNTYEELDYSAADYWLKVELKDGAEFYEISFRELLSVPYAEVARNATLFSPGMIIPYAGPLSTIPDGWILCDGDLLDKNEYPDLYAAMGNSWGGNTTHFRLPDARGMFLRGVANGTGNDPDRNNRIASASGGLTGDNVGSKQYDEFQSHLHGSGTYKSTDYFHEDNSNGWDDTSTPEDPAKHLSNVTRDVTGSSGSTGGNETRPINIYVNYIIKY